MNGLLPSWIGTRAYDRDGARLGHVADVLFDRRTHAPSWLLIVLLRSEDRFVFAPAAGVTQHTGGVMLSAPRALVRTAPTSAAPPDDLSIAHAEQLARHYGVACPGGPWAGVALPELARAVDRVRMSVPHAA